MIYEKSQVRRFTLLPEQSLGNSTFILGLSILSVHTLSAAILSLNLSRLIFIIEKSNKIKCLNQQLTKFNSIIWSEGWGDFWRLARSMAVATGEVLTTEARSQNSRSRKRARPRRAQMPWVAAILQSEMSYNLVVGLDIEDLSLDSS